METKFYTLFTALFLTCLGATRAQDSTSCNAYFQATDNQGLVTFRAYDTLPHIQHAWSFGDGGYLTLSTLWKVVQHHYSASGTYTVVHYIQDSLGGGCHDSVIQTITVGVPPSCPVYIGESVDSIHHPHIYNFYAYPASGLADTVRWYINDSLTVTGDSLRNRSFSPGYYSICARRNTAAGCHSVSCTYIYVSADTSSSDTTHVPPPPPADTCNISFTYTFNPAQTNQVFFHARDSVLTDSLTWVISRSSDTVVLHGRDAVRTFTDTGCYHVGLYVTRHPGCQGYTEQWICIDSLPGSNFIVSYPNPSPSLSNIDVRLDQDHTIYIRIFNSMGHLVLFRKEAGYKGLNHITLPTAGLPKGVYYVQVEYGGVTKRSKIQKL
ncbi:MAG: T9SS type A sorting domain-containing protein [Chitinophagaceae bacterium]|nr:T9SS type A sorting domain-containing protein [Chitinophagaceae bacterium]